MEINQVLEILSNPFWFLCFCLGIDILVGDPAYAGHPVRIIGRSLTWVEGRLRAVNLDGRYGGFLLFLILVVLVGGGASAIWKTLSLLNPILGLCWEVYLTYSFLALGDLVEHGRRIARVTAKQDLVGARSATAALVGRDTDRMDFAACNRAAVESVAESLVDGVISPLFWFALFGLPGILIFKIASTMDSMVGYKYEPYLRFGWFGARLDDAMNWIPARMTWLLMVLCASVLPGYSARRTWSIARLQHALLPGPNKGWSETAAAGALSIRLAGPIYKQGTQVNDLWIGSAGDRVGGTVEDVNRMIIIAYGTTVLFMGLVWILDRQGWMIWQP